MKNQIYPFGVYSPENFPSDLARALWLRIKPALAPDLIWYNADLLVESRNVVTVRVYNMECPVLGGTGKLIFTTRVSEFTESERKLIDSVITSEQRKLAAIELADQDAKVQAARVELVRVQMFDWIE